MIIAEAKHAMRRARRAVLKRVQYAFMRHIRARTADEARLLEEGPRVLANSVPKAGTNLFAQLMRMMPNTVDRWNYHIDETLPGIERQLRSGRRGQALTAHFPWSREMAALARELDYRVFLTVRDPRDIAVSSVNYVTRMDLSHPLHRILAALPDDDARLLTLIDPPADVLVCLPEVWKNDGLTKFLPWLDEPNCLIVRFEDLVGANVGGDDARQRETIRKITDHIGSPLDDVEIEGMADRLFGNSGSKTFHKGQIGGWKAHFKPEHTTAFKRCSNEVMVRLGYENNENW